MNTDLFIGFLLMLPIVLLGSCALLRICKIREIERKGIHIMIAVAMVSAVIILSKDSSLLFGLVIALGLFVFVLVERLRGEFDSRQFGYLLFPAGFILTHILFYDISILAIVYGMLVLGFSDSFASLVGMKWGTLNRFRKSWLGTCVFFFTTVIISVAMGISLIGVIISSLALTAIELISRKGMDNFLLPIIGAGLFIVFI